MVVLAGVVVVERHGADLRSPGASVLHAVAALPRVLHVHRLTYAPGVKRLLRGSSVQAMFCVRACSLYLGTNCQC